MTNEAVIVELLGTTPGEPMSYNVADGTAIAKGELMQLTDNRTALISADNKVPAGIAASEKVASDGQVYLACYTNGIFDLLDAGAGGAVGVNVVLGGVNSVRDAAATEAEKGYIIGKRFATAGAAATEEVRVLIGKHH